MENQELTNDRREFLKTSLKLWLGAIISGSLISTLTWCSDGNDEKDNSWRKYFNNKYYKELKELKGNALIESNILLEEMPTAYDNIIYAKSVANAKNIQSADVYKDCINMMKIDSKIKQYAQRFWIPYSKLVWLIMLESSGKATAWSKWWCYWYCQLNRPMAKRYGAIVNGKDYRDNIDYALTACCRFLTDMHKRYDDENRSLAFAWYHMGETHMWHILKAARAESDSVNTFQDVLWVNTKKLATTIMSLQDESYKYYPRLLAAGRVFNDFKNNRSKFNHTLQEYIDMPISRKPSLAEEYIWFGENQFETFQDVKDNMEDKKLYGLKNNNKIIYHQVGTLTKDEEKKELLKMTTPCVLWLINLVASHFDKTLKVNSLTRPQEYNDLVYRNKWSNVKNKRTSHATWYTVDFWLFDRKDDTNHLAYLLYMLECQWKISFLKERDHFHININPKFKKYFENLID